MGKWAAYRMKLWRKRRSINGSVLKHSPTSPDRKDRQHSCGECFNTHIRKSVLWILFPIAGCNPVAINKWGGWQVVRFYQGPPNFPLVVKWYNNRLITGHYKFDSCREDHV
jgi:hypothetical protein